MPQSPLFFLLPVNDSAKRCIEDPTNAHMIKTRLEDARSGIPVGLMNSSRTPGCIMSFGRSGHVSISGEQVSRLQCQFILHETTHEIILRDSSAYQSTTLTDRVTNAQLLRGVPRQWVVRINDNLIVGMGGLDGDLMQFEFGWPLLGNDEEARRIMEENAQEFLDLPKNPRYAVTRDERTTPSSRYEARAESPWTSTKLFHRRLMQLGQGSSGSVFRTVNLHTGDHLAVKIVLTDTSERNNAYYKAALEREVEILHRVSHPNLVDFRHAQGFRMNDTKIEIFMTLYDGSLGNLLVWKPEFSADADLVLDLLKQLLKGIIYLAEQSIVHRDIKPPNILFAYRPGGQYQWCLGDFGLAKVEDENSTKVGSGRYRAPEALSGGPQGHKMDVYSLSMTMLYVMGSGEFRSRFSNTSEPLSDSAEFEEVLEKTPRLRSG